MSKYTWEELYNQGYDTDRSDLKESTYFSCIKIISESVAKCDIQVKQKTKEGEFVAESHPLFELLNLRFNDYMSSLDAVKTFIAIGKHYGRAGLVIQRNFNDVIGLYPVKLTGVTVDTTGIISGAMNNKVLWDYESVGGETGSVFDKDVIVYKDFTLDGINTKATTSIVGQTLDTSIKSQKHLNDIFSNGMSSKLVIQLTSDIKDESELKKIQEKFNRIYSFNGKIFTLPAGFTAQPLDLKLTDMQFAELRRLSKEEIATSMQVPLSKLGILRETAISEEQDNIKLWSDNLSVIITQIEKEMDYKLLTREERAKGYRIRFNIDILLRLDAKAQADVLTMYVNKGVLTANEAREKLGVPRTQYGDEIFMPSGQISIKQLMEGGASWANKNPVKGGE
ncbi:phage portal protein [Clostridium sp. CF012]|uniref:phage portal protein n=1 Tax=Clostridium sp. CF012 TaxID=2843319 RepID=UPI001C0AFC7C|nr:phage portal protein [Clostridium sp. CF012]MBU3145733.1 phage portal protein [Clostridium sp. CF012]